MMAESPSESSTGYHIYQHSHKRKSEECCICGMPKHSGSGYKPSCQCYHSSKQKSERGTRLWFHHQPYKRRKKSSAKYGRRCESEQEHGYTEEGFEKEHYCEGSQSHCKDIIQKGHCHHGRKCQICGVFNEMIRQEYKKSRKQNPNCNLNLDGFAENIYITNEKPLRQNKIHRVTETACFRKDGMQKVHRNSSSSRKTGNVAPVDRCFGVENKDMDWLKLSLRISATKPILDGISPKDFKLAIPVESTYEPLIRVREFDLNKEPEGNQEEEKLIQATKVTTPPLVFETPDEVEIAARNVSCESPQRPGYFVGDENEEGEDIRLVEASTQLASLPRQNSESLGVVENNVLVLEASPRQNIENNLDYSNAPSGTGGKDLSAKRVYRNGFKARSKRMAGRSLLVGHIDDELVSFPIPCARRNQNLRKTSLVSALISKPRMWDLGVHCDLCRKGPSLFLGDWYAWCCGKPLFFCDCSEDTKTKLKHSLARGKKRPKQQKKNDGHSWSGKVHKMCALWSSEVYEVDGEGEQLHGVFDAVRRGRTLYCASPECRDPGATLGCRVRSCRRSFHYPCSEKLASQLQCRMWEGLHYPLACIGHRHVKSSCSHAKEKAPSFRSLKFKAASRPDNSKSQGIVPQSPNIDGIIPSQDCNSIENRDPIIRRALPDVIAKAECSTFDKDGEEGKNWSNDMDNDGDMKSIKVVLNKYITRDQKPPVGFFHVGLNILCEDISEGKEKGMIPCTNDVDDEPPPVFTYITENRFLGKAKEIFDSVMGDRHKIAKGCKGCNHIDSDNPYMEVSVHVNGSRNSDARFDWQNQPMLGRLPYDQYGRLLLAPETNDIIECNGRCLCGSSCQNRQLQNGLQMLLEVFKTENRGWGVRTLQPIPRGKFVMEYVGEVLTCSEAEERETDYLFSVDHPDVSDADELIIDGSKMSNVARLVNHSCNGNLRTYRVYIETLDLRLCRVGMYAARDIEIGEELVCDYMSDPTNDHTSGGPTAIKCHCGETSCRKWL